MKLGNFYDANGKVHTPKETDIVNWRISVYGLIQHGDRIYFTKPNWSNKFELPGGGVEINESIFETLQREIREETGLEIISISDVPFYVHESNFYYYNDTTETYNHSIGLFYRVQIESDLPVNDLSDKNIIDHKWLEISELNNSELNEMSKVALSKVIF